MLFTQFEFIFIFLPVTFAGYFLIARVFEATTARLVWLAAASLAFYGYWDVNFLRVIALSFFGLAAFVAVDAARALLGASDPEHSTVGIALAAVSLAVMPLLSWVERHTGRELGSASAVADSRQTLLCTYLSAVLLVGLVLNSALGWTWAVPLAALVIAGVAVREGIEAWRGDTCCAPVGALLAESTPCDDDCCAD